MNLVYGAVISQPCLSVTSTTALLDTATLLSTPIDVHPPSIGVYRRPAHRAPPSSSFPHIPVLGCPSIPFHRLAERQSLRSTLSSPPLPCLRMREVPKAVESSMLRTQARNLMAARTSVGATSPPSLPTTTHHFVHIIYLQNLTHPTTASQVL